MSYISVEEMVSAFGRREIDMIADRDMDGNFEPVVVRSHIEQAEQQINFAVAQRCTIPLVNPAPEVLGMLKQWALDITRYRLTGSSGVTATSDVDTRYKEAREDLARVAAGKIVLCGQDANAGLLPDALTAGEAEAVDTDSGCCRQFSMVSLRDFTRFGRGGFAS